MKKANKIKHLDHKKGEIDLIAVLSKYLRISVNLGRAQELACDIKNNHALTRFINSMTYTVGPLSDKDRELVILKVAKDNYCNVTLKQVREALHDLEKCQADKLCGLRAPSLFFDTVSLTAKGKVETQHEDG